MTPNRSSARRATSMPENKDSRANPDRGGKARVAGRLRAVSTPNLVRPAVAVIPAPDSHASEDVTSVSALALRFQLIKGAKKHA